jgi:AraC-like DNA-binding protein
MATSICSNDSSRRLIGKTGRCGNFGVRKIMKNLNYTYEPHLTVREFFIPTSEEWTPRLVGWSMIQVRQGSGYYLQPQSNRELEPGAVLLAAALMQGTVRASQLGGMSICSFNVIPARLIGLVTLSDLDFLELASKKDFSPQIFPAGSPVALKMGELCASPNRDGLLFRLKLLQLFIEASGKKLKPAATNEDSADAKERLQTLLKQMPASELMELDFHGLAQMTRCTSRHLSRIFYELVGMSFRNKRAELRLARARELLATSNAKVVEVALESGYKSLSLFNLMFSRRFGTSPSKWRQKHEDQKDNGRLQNKRRRIAPDGNEVATFKVKLNPRTRQTA